MNRRIIPPAIVLILLFPAALAQQASVTGSASLISPQSIAVSGDFNLGFNQGLIYRVDYFAGPIFLGSSSIAPFPLFDDAAGSLPPELSSLGITARVYTSPNDFVSNSYQLIRAVQQHARMQSVLLSNGDFQQGISPWMWHSKLAPYVVMIPDGKEDPGALRITPNYEGDRVSEVWAPRVDVHPGDKIIYEGWLRAGALKHSQVNNGAVIGWDLRAKGTDEIIYTLNGPATLNSTWTYVKVENVIPCEGTPDSQIRTWVTGDGKSGTITGARAGLWHFQYPQYLGVPLPRNLSLTPWTSIWLTDSVESADFDNLQLTIIPDVLSC